MPKHHQIQLYQRPYRRTHPQMTTGVSDAKEVATIEVPAIHQGRLRPEMKYSRVDLPARRERMTPAPRAKRR